MRNRRSNRSGARSEGLQREAKEVGEMGTWRGGRKGQSTLEYILVLAAILVAVIIGANTLVKTGVNNVMTDSGNVIKDSTANMKSKLGL